MELRHLIQRFSYRIEPKAEGGFIAHATDPTVPPLEAPPREELQQKIQANLAAAMAEAFPGLQLPLENKQPKFEVHIERKPEGGFAVHSAEPGTPGIEPATQETIVHFAEELLGFVDKNFPDLSKALAARVESGVAKALANRETVILNADSQSRELLIPKTGGWPISFASFMRMNGATMRPATPERKSALHSV